MEAPSVQGPAAACCSVGWAGLGWAGRSAHTAALVLPHWVCGRRLVEAQPMALEAGCVDAVLEEMQRLMPHGSNVVYLLSHDPSWLLKAQVGPPLQRPPAAARCGGLQSCSALGVGVGGGRVAWPARVRAPVCNRCLHPLSPATSVPGRGRGRSMLAGTPRAQARDASSSAAACCRPASSGWACTRTRTGRASSSGIECGAVQRKARRRHRREPRGPQPRPWQRSPHALGSHLCQPGPPPGLGCARMTKALCHPGALRQTWHF